MNSASSFPCESLPAFPSEWKVALRAEPAADAGDLGWSTCERALVASVRQKEFSWETEQAYRDWARRFAGFLAPRSVESADGRDLGAFLTALAVEHRASRSTQKEALNALVFLLREALRRPLQEIAFERALPRRNVPTMLSQTEVEQLRRLLDGTTRLMVELANGAGLRLLELLRLRVHHVDLARMRVLVHAGKGEKHRVAILPARLIATLDAHIGRLRRLHELDRAARLPAVWLPEGLAAKYPGAGETFEWQWLFPARELSVDPMTGNRRRHHVSIGTFEHAIRDAARRAGITKRVTPHMLRHGVLGQTVAGGGWELRILA